ARRAEQARAQVRVPERAAPADHRARAGPRRGRRRLHRGRDRLLVPGPRHADPAGDPEPRLLPDPGDLPVRDCRRADRELLHRHRLRDHRPAHADRDAGPLMAVSDQHSDATVVAEERIPAIAEPTEASIALVRHRGGEFFYFARRNVKFVIGFCLVASMFVLAIVGPHLTSNAPLAFNGPTDSHPSHAYWFATTSFGQDVFSQFVEGLRAAFLVGAL